MAVNLNLARDILRKKFKNSTLTLTEPILIIPTTVDCDSRGEYMEVNGGDPTGYINRYEPFQILMKSGKIYDRIVADMSDTDSDDVLVIRIEDVEQNIGFISRGDISTVSEFIVDGNPENNVEGKLLRRVYIAYDDIESISVSAAEPA